MYHLNALCGKESIIGYFLIYIVYIILGYFLVTIFKITIWQKKLSLINQFLTQKELSLISEFFTQKYCRHKLAVNLLRSKKIINNTRQ